MGKGKKLISIVVPLYFEEAVLPEFYSRLDNFTRTHVDSYGFEMIFINDGSTDGTWSILEDIAEKDERVKLLNFSRNFGHQLAVTAGIDHASGDALVIIDGDLQDPPEVIGQMLDKWEDGYKVVYGVRAKRQGETVFKKTTASLFYRLLGRLSDVKIPMDTGDFRLIDRAVADGLKAMPEKSRFIRGMVPWVGFSSTPLVYQRDARYAGETKYSMRRMIRFALDGITGFSEKPLHLAFRVGMFITTVSFLYICWLVLAKLMAPERLIQGWASVIVIVLFLGGIQLVTIGILGIYIGKIYLEVKQRPLYIVQEKRGF